MNLDSAMSGKGTLAAGDTINKTGAGTLVDTAAALDSASKLIVNIQEGIFKEGLKRSDSEFHVSDGATMICTAAMSNVAADGHPWHVYLAGTGAAGQNGAFVVGVSASGSSTKITWHLDADATIYSDRNCAEFSGADTDAEGRNVFHMNGHNLTLKADSTDHFFRLRHRSDWTNPGMLILDHCGLTRYSGGEFKVFTATSRQTATTMPCVKLVNGAKIALLNTKMASKIDCFDCENGTKFCKVKPDGDAATASFTLNKVIGSPEIVEEGSYTITVNKYAARATDIAAGKYLTGANLRFAANAPVYVIGATELAAGAQTAAQATSAMSGSVANGNVTAAINGTDLTVETNSDLFDIDSEKGEVRVGVGSANAYFTDSPLGYLSDAEKAACSGKKLVKIGSKRITGNADITALGFTELVIEEGAFRVSALGQLPCANNEQKVTVEDGATLDVNGKLNALAPDSTHKLTVTMAGTGNTALGYAGAVSFQGSTPDKYSASYTRFILSANATMAFTSLGLFTFSNGYDDIREINRFELGGHDLTFLNSKGSACTDNQGIRFRNLVRFYDPGRLILDGINLTRSDGTFAVWHSDDDQKNDWILPVVLKNGAKLNCRNNYMASRITVESEDPTCALCYLNSSDTDIQSNDYTIPSVKGPLTITPTNGHKIVVGKYIAKAADLTAEPARLLQAGAGTEIRVVDVDDATGLTVETAYTFAHSDAGFGVGAGALNAPFVTAAIANEGTDLTLTRANIDTSDMFIVNVPEGETWTWSDVKTKLSPTAEQLTGKKLVKTGLGTLAPVAGEYGGAESVCTEGFTELIIYGGDYRVNCTNALPMVAAAENGKYEMHVTVKNGATLRINKDLSYNPENARPVQDQCLTSLYKKLFITAEGAGCAAYPGAVRFEVLPATNNQRVQYVLTGDTVFKIPGVSGDRIFILSSTGGTDSSNNLFIMNGHELTFSRSGGSAAAKLAVRFRYQVNFVNPGALVLDNLGLTRLGSSGFSVRDAVSGGNQLTMPLKLKNGAWVNCVNDTMTEKLSYVEFLDAGCSFAQCCAQDTPSPIHVNRVIGHCFNVSASQHVTITGELQVCAADLAAGKCIDAYRDTEKSGDNLNFAPGCRVTADTTEGLAVNQIILRTKKDDAALVRPKTDAALKDVGVSAVWDTHDFGGEDGDLDVLKFAEHIKGMFLLVK